MSDLEKALLELRRAVASELNSICSAARQQECPHHGRMARALIDVDAAESSEAASAPQGKETK